MSAESTRRAKAWFSQAESDARTATALLAQPQPMQPVDVGCHVTALCAQAVEKSIKAYVILNKSTPKMSHRADKYLVPLLSSKQLLRYPEHYALLSRLFDTGTRGAVRRLLDLTPGTLDDKNLPNTEYPWTDATGARTPIGASEFADHSMLQSWVQTALRVSAELHKLSIAVDRAPTTQA